MTLTECQFIAATLAHLSKMADALPANDSRHMALIVAIHQARAVAESLLKDRIA